MLLVQVKEIYIRYALLQIQNLVKILIFLLLDSCIIYKKKSYNYLVNYRKKLEEPLYYRKNNEIKLE